MSELEKMYREEYRTKRKKHMFYQQIGLGLLVILLLIFSIAYFKTDKATYVYYSDDGNAIHYAYLKDGNGFFEEEYLNGSHAYVSSLIDHMRAVFSYGLKFDTDQVKYTYTYDIATQLEILDIASGAPLYNPIVCRQIDPTSVSGEGNSFAIEKQVNIDFQEYNKRANEFITKNSLKDTSSTLIVRMTVTVVGVSDTFTGDHLDKYVTELRIPLCKLAFKPVVSSTVPAGEKRILAVSGNTRQVFGILAMISLIGFVLDVCVYLIFVITTRDRFIDYSRRVARICKNYKSYIQCIGNDFVTDGYLVLRIGEFSEMLEIRDTVQKPVLMYENADKTCTRFFIAADGIVYLHEIQVEKFEELNTDAGNHTVTESFAENAESSDASESKLCSHTKTLAKKKNGR